MITHPLRPLFASLLILGLCLRAGAASFTVLGTETPTHFDFLFTISNNTGVALPGKAWDGALQKYQDEETDQMLSLKYWHLDFGFDQAKSLVTVNAWHLVDPHTLGADLGGKFNWSVSVPAATKPVLFMGNPTGALRGSDSKSDKFDHQDSQGKHSDKYDAVLSLTVNQVDPGSTMSMDHLNLRLEGSHRGFSVPDALSTLVAGLIVLLALLLFYALAQLPAARKVPVRTDSPGVDSARLGRD